MGVATSQTEMKEEKEEGKEECQDAADKSRQHQQRQINLLDHIDAVQDEVSHRMDFIEKELDGESDVGRGECCFTHSGFIFTNIRFKLLKCERTRLITNKEQNWILHQDL